MEERKQIYNKSLETFTNAFAITDLEGNLTYTSDTFLQLWGYNDYQEVLGKSTEIFWQMDEKIAELLTRVEKNGSYVKNVIARKKNGAEFTTQVSVNLVKDSHGIPVYMTLLIFNTATPQSLDTEILQISERIQQRIGEDLHDSLGQILTGVSFLSKGLEKELALKVPDEAKKVSEITKLANKAIKQIRCLTSILNPLKLEPDTLIETLQEFADNIQQVFDISCIFYFSNPDPISDTTIAKHLYRIVQEAVSNSIKHGKAKTITIKLISLNNRITIMIKDDGTGIPPLSKHQKGMGLNIMKQRAQLIGASLTIKKQRRGGTTIICSVRQNCDC